MNVNYKLVGGQVKSVDTGAETVGDFLSEINHPNYTVKMDRKDVTNATELVEDAFLILTERVKGGVA